MDLLYELIVKKKHGFETTQKNLRLICSVGIFGCWKPLGLMRIVAKPWMASSRLGALRSVSNLGWFSLSSLTNLGIWLKANCWHNEREDSGGNHWLDSESCT